MLGFQSIWERRVESILYTTPLALRPFVAGALLSSETEPGRTGRRRLVSPQRLTLRGDEGRHEVNAGRARHLKGMDLAALDPRITGFVVGGLTILVVPRNRS